MIAILLACSNNMGGEIRAKKVHFKEGTETRHFSYNVRADDLRAKSAIDFIPVRKHCVVSKSILKREVSSLQKEEVIEEDIKAAIILASLKYKKAQKEYDEDYELFSDMALNLRKDRIFLSKLAKKYKISLRIKIKDMMPADIDNSFREILNKLMEQKHSASWYRENMSPILSNYFLRKRGYSTKREDQENRKIRIDDNLLALTKILQFLSTSKVVKSEATDLFIYEAWKILRSKKIPRTTLLEHISRGCLLKEELQYVLNKKGY